MLPIVNTMEAFLLCPPNYFDVEYAINPWMTGEAIDRNLAIDQWNNLCKAITEAGGTVKTINPVNGLPDMVFTANSGTVHNNTVVMSRMRHKERQKETKNREKRREQQLTLFWGTCCIHEEDLHELTRDERRPTFA